MCVYIHTYADTHNHIHNVLYTQYTQHKIYTETYLKIPATLLNHFEPHSGNQSKIIGLNLMSAWKTISGYLYFKSLLN